MINGLGIPLATHNNVLVSPSVMVTGAVVLRVIFGFTVNKGDYTSVSQFNAQDIRGIASFC